MPQSNAAYLQLCVNDLLHPTEKSELLLEALTATQLEEIEKTLHKIKEKKQTSSKQHIVTPTTSTPQTANPCALHHDWALVAAQIAKALAETMSNTVNVESKPPTPSLLSGSSSDQTKSNTITPITSPTTSTISTAVNSTKASTPPLVTTLKLSTPTPDVVTATANATTTATPSSSTATTTAAAGSVVPNHEPRTEVREGVEWVSFVYSHHRVLRRYSIRTDVDQVDLQLLDDKFKSENCVYPRANLSPELYKGNRWAYETECNTLGWKLAYLNSTEIAGKRGLIQRAVDSYRNRYPSMRSRRVARQEKLLRGTLRKRKQRDSEEPMEEEPTKCKQMKKEDVKADIKCNQDLPKTVSIDDGLGGTKYRIRINVESVSLDSIDLAFRKANCVFPRAMEINTLSPFASQRQIEEAKCNELAWKLAWLNPKQLGNRKNLLQRVLDVYRSKFLPELKIRKNSLRTPTALSIDTNLLDTAKISTPLTVAALAAQQDELSPVIKRREKACSVKKEDDESLYSGTTESIDFHDCFSPSNDAPFTAPMKMEGLTLSVPATFSGSQHPLSCRLSISSSSSSTGSSSQDEDLFKSIVYTDPLPSAGVDFEQCDYIKTEDIDPLMSQLFYI